MTFKKFVNTTEFSDKDIQGFQKWFANRKFPASNNPEVHTLFLSMHLDNLSDDLILGYKKAMLAYSTYPKNLLNKELKNNPTKLLEVLNRI